jgi:hypothetical protein
MEHIKLGGVIAGGVFVALLLAWYAGFFEVVGSFGGGDSNAINCSVATVAAATVGDDISSVVLASSTRRAWATLQIPFSSSAIATNTNSLSFDDGAAATLAGGLELATNTPSISFGRNTDFPYAGAVTGITSTGSTTLRVTQCNY